MLGDRLARGGLVTLMSPGDRGLFSFLFRVENADARNWADAPAAMPEFIPMRRFRASG
jgi:hypothetical protein